MRRILAALLALAFICSFSTAVFAADTTLTTTVPDATYTLNIPADQEITFGATDTNIGNITVTNSSGFAKGKDLQVTINYEPFKCEGISTEIPYELSLYYPGETYTDPVEKILESNGTFIFRGKAGGSIEENVWLGQTNNLSGGYWQLYAEEMRLKANSEDWGKALAGNYSTTITFTAEVVVSE